MYAFFADIDSWMITIVLAILISAGWLVGFWRGRRLPPTERSNVDTAISGSAMALLGLLLGFTFSMSLGKHEQRREMVVTDSNAIGDFYTCASLLKEPIRGQLQKEIRDYTKARLDALAGSGSPSEETLAKMIASQNRMQALVGEAVNAGTPVAVPLVTTLNNLTSSHAARVAAGVDRLPPVIILLLAFSGAVTMGLMGFQRGAAGERIHGGTFGFIIMVALVVWAILDLNQPRKGLITVSQDPMERTYRSIQ